MPLLLRKLGYDTSWTGAAIAGEASWDVKVCAEKSSDAARQSGDGIFMAVGYAGAMEFFAEHGKTFPKTHWRGDY